MWWCLTKSVSILLLMMPYCISSAKPKTRPSPGDICFNELLSENTNVVYKSFPQPQSSLFFVFFLFFLFFKNIYYTYQSFVYYHIIIIICAFLFCQWNFYLKLDWNVSPSQNMNWVSGGQKYLVIWMNRVCAYPKALWLTLYDGV